MEYKLRKGFTIIELLVVVIVIAVLITLSIIGYSNISSKATISTLQSDLTNAKKQLLAFQSSSSTNSFPTGINCTSTSTTEICLRPTGSNTFSYIVNNSANPPNFSLTASNGSTSYWVNGGSGVLTKPNLVSSGLVLNLDAADPASYPGSGNIWYDTSGSGNTVTMSNPSLFNSGTNTFDMDYASTMFLSNFVSYGLSSEWTVQQIISPPSGVNPNWNFLFGGDWVVGGYWMFHGGGTLCLYSDFFNSVTYLTYSGISLGGWVPYNRYTVLTIVGRPFDLATNRLQFDIYINGTLRQNLIHTGSPRTTNSVEIRYIGGTGRKGQYKFAHFSNWNRALTSTEINQNFEAVRGRYGL